MIVERRDPRTKETTYGIEGVDMDGSRQLYPYDSKGEALKRLKFLQLKQDPADPRFKDPKYVSVIKSLDRA